MHAIALYTEAVPEKDYTFDVYWTTGVNSKGTIRCQLSDNRCHRYLPYILHTAISGKPGSVTRSVCTINWYVMRRGHTWQSVNMSDAKKPTGIEMEKAPWNFDLFVLAYNEIAESSHSGHFILESEEEARDLERRY